MGTHKLSASALSSFLKSPKGYYWRYIAKLEPVSLSVSTYDHDKICGTIWAEFVHRFYQGVDEATNTRKTLADWFEQTDGWVPDKARTRLTNALESWAASYYQMFNIEDGVRSGGSELFLENDRFLGYLDGLSDTGIIHEVKSTSRSPQLAGQLWKVTNSIQIKLYCVLAQAKGVCVEFAFKDTPYQLFRGPITPVSEAQRMAWEQGFNNLADYIYSLGDDPNNYVCNPDGCCLVTKGVTSMCPYELLCEEGINNTTKYGFKPKSKRK